MNDEIPLSVPHLNIDIIDNLKECVQSGWVSTGGRFIDDFERKFASYVGAGDAVSVQSGTAALHLALMALGVKSGDEVIVPALAFIGAVNPVKYIGAAPVFMDCDDSLCMDPEKLSVFCSQKCSVTEAGLVNNLTKRKISAIIIVHVFGNMADMGRIMEIARRYGIAVVEDAAEAVGTYCAEGAYEGRFAGTIGDIGVYSFNANKIITTGGGGMAVSKNQGCADRIRYLSTTAKDDGLYFVHNDVGYNYRMLNIQAAIGVSQIGELEKFIDIKEKNYGLYRGLLAGVAGVTLMPFRQGTRPNYWFYSIYVDRAGYGLSRDELLERLIAAGVQCRPVWKLANTQMPYSGFQSFNIEKAPEYARNILNVPCSVGLTEEQASRVCEIMRENSQPQG